ncbi:hypothetical protein Daus18300_003203 [Diaporthe australafricana]|uniref:Glutathione S-transferase n=1 Tax=Diaporthe australafricana TaxID=127596 RepID=A0ABR3XIP0_9PEZI
MARFAIALGNEYHQGPKGVPKIIHKLINLHRDENLEEWFLTEINSNGQVPVMTRERLDGSKQTRLEVTTESVAISKFFGESFFPGLLGGAHKGEVDNLLKSIHEIQAFSLSIKSPSKEQGVEVPDPGLDALLARTDISGNYRRALEYKREQIDSDSYYQNLAYALRPENINKAKAQAADLFQQLLLLYRDHHLSSATEQEQGIWLFGATGPTILDAHAVALIARIDDAGQDELVPADLLAYARKIRSLPAWETVTHGRNTIWNKGYGHVHLLEDF